MYLQVHVPPKWKTVSGRDKNLMIELIVVFQWYIQSTCAPQGQGLYEGLDWLSNQLANS